MFKLFDKIKYKKQRKKIWTSLPCICMIEMDSNDSERG